MIFLSKTKMNDHKIDGIRRRMRFSGGFNVPHVGRIGGLSLWWDNLMEVDITFSSEHIISARLRG